MRQCVPGTRARGEGETEASVERFIYPSPPQPIATDPQLTLTSSLGLPPITELLTCVLSSCHVSPCIYSYKYDNNKHRVATYIHIHDHNNNSFLLNLPCRVNRRCELRALNRLSVAGDLAGDAVAIRNFTSRWHRRGVPDWSRHRGQHPGAHG